MWEVPWIAFISLAIVLISWTANVRLPWGLPGGLAAVIVGIVVGWLAYFFGFGLTALRREGPKLRTLMNMNNRIVLIVFRSLAGSVQRR